MTTRTAYNRLSPAGRTHYFEFRKCFAARRGAVQWYREGLVLNRFDPHSPSAGEAEVKYLDGDFRVLRPGAFVRCAITGTPIPLEELKYWSVERQEAYA